MQKHIAFWTGFLVAAVIIVPVAIGIWGASEQAIRDWVAVIFIATMAAVAIFVFIFFVGERLLARVVGSVSMSLENIVAKVIAAGFALKAGDDKEARRIATQLSTSVTAWFAWTRFYKWVISTLIGLVLAFGAFAGTVLLFEQNRKLSEQTLILERQSDLARLQFVSELRQRMHDSSELVIVNPVSGTDDNNYYTKHAPEIRFRDDEEQAICTLKPTRRVLRSMASGSIMEEIDNLLKQPDLREEVVSALQSLTSDRGHIAISAALALERADIPLKRKRILVDGVFLQFVTLNTSKSVVFMSSYFTNFRCGACKFSSFGSVYENQQSAESGVIDSSVIDFSQYFSTSEPSSSSFDADASYNVRSVVSLENQEIGTFQLSEDENFWIRKGSICKNLKSLALQNSFYEFNRTEVSNP